MFEYFRSKKRLLNRIIELERLNESLIGSNSILQEQLTLSQSKEGMLLNKIFDISGINKNKVSIQQTPPTIDFNELAKRKLPWPQIRENLEKEAYWEAHKNKTVPINKEINEPEEIQEELG